jgi:serine/threonine protein kinase
VPDLAGYDFIRPLGDGATGPVFLARELSANRYVVVRQIVGAWSDNPRVLARYPAEAEALERMSHPNVIAVQDLRSSGNDLFVVMEYIQGPSLRELMDRHAMTPPAALGVISDVSAALDYAGGRSIFHGNLKPSNILIDGSGVAKVGDFGLVSMLSLPRSSNGEPGPVLGTPAYMSPEHASGRPDVGPGSDVYSLAVLAYELLVGRLPFPSVAGDAQATLDAHISGAVPRPTSIAPGFPASIEEVLIRGLDKDPAGRPATAGEFWKELSTAAQAAWPDWAAESDLAAIAAAASPPPPPPLPLSGTAHPRLVASDPDQPSAPEEPSVRRRVAIGWVGLLLLVAAIGGVAVSVGHNLPLLGSGASLRISKVSVTVTPVTGHCPSTVYRFTATVVTNGEGGPVSYRWNKPLGGDTETYNASIPNGQKETTAILEFKFQGQGATEGDGVVHIISPTDIRSAPAHIVYQCP